MGEKPFTCGVCGRNFKREHYLALHATVHEKDKLSKSGHSQEVLTEANYLEQLDVIPKVFNCEECGRNFKRKYCLAAHSTVHKRDKTREAGYSQQILHKTVDIVKKPFSCEVCGRSFALKRFLGTHAKIHKKDKLVEITHSQQMLSEETHVESDLQQGAAFHTAERQFLENVSVHKSDRSFESEYSQETPTKSDRSFESEYSQETPTEENVNMTEKPFTCGVCGRNFKREHYLALHATVHEKEKSRSHAEFVGGTLNGNIILPFTPQYTRKISYPNLDIARKCLQKQIILNN
ncbi:Zinc finger, C2H2 type [Popillia japonica]